MTGVSGATAQTPNPYGSRLRNVSFSPIRPPTKLDFLCAAMSRGAGCGVLLRGCCCDVFKRRTNIRIRAIGYLKCRRSNWRIGK